MIDNDLDRIVRQVADWKPTKTEHILPAVGWLFNFLFHSLLFMSDLIITVTQISKAFTTNKEAVVSIDQTLG